MKVISKNFMFINQSIIHVHKADEYWHVMNNKNSLFKSRFKWMADLYKKVLIVRVNRSLRILSKAGIVKEDK